MKLYAAPLNFRTIAEEFSVPTDVSQEVLDEAQAAQDRYATQRRVEDRGCAPRRLQQCICRLGRAVSSTLR